MDYNNFISYFDRFIKPYLPFKNNKTYQSFCSLLKDNYFKDSYLNIPEHLATYVEDQKINIELYSILGIYGGLLFSMYLIVFTNYVQNIIKVVRKEI